MGAGKGESRRSRRVVPSVIEARGSTPKLDDPDAEYRVIVTLDGVPCARVRIPPLGRVASERFWDVAVREHARPKAAAAVAERRVRHMLRLHEPPEPSTLSISVIVCTHRRPEHLVGVLDALCALDPAADEVLVVDNDPGDADCRAAVEERGLTYLREDRRGLDAARQAGLRAATGDIVCFTDDDCIPCPGWLARLPEHFVDPVVGAVTGPGFANELRTRAQIRFEDTGGFGRGFELRREDWRTTPPASATSLGAGACMAFRRTRLVMYGEVFPLELDAGTPTQSGGDMIALFSVLAAGDRIVYDPGMFFLHTHRPDWSGMHRAYWGYGVGLSAALTKLLVERGESAVVVAWSWFVTNYVRAQVGRAAGIQDAVDVRIAVDYLRGGLAGPVRWRRSRRAHHAPSRPTRRASSPPGRHQVRTARPEVPDLSVIVTTRARPGVLAACLDALQQQEVDATWEVIVCDDDPAGSAAAVEATRSPDVTLVHTGGTGAARARNAGARRARGTLLLFLDDDLIAEPGLVRHHVERHSAPDRPAVVIGACPREPEQHNLVSMADRTWWHDAYRARLESPAVLFVDVLSGNMSVARSTFAELGGFDERFAQLRREDWEWGLRVLETGLKVVFEPDARAGHRFAITAGGSLEARWRDGRGDRLLVSEHPAAVTSLPLYGRTVRWPHLVVAALMDRRRVRTAVGHGLELTERTRMRGLTNRLLLLAQAGAYVAGRGRPSRVEVAPPTPVDLAAPKILAVPRGVAPVLAVRVGAVNVGTVIPSSGTWSTPLVDQLLRAGGEPLLDAVAASVHLGPPAGDRARRLRAEYAVAPPTLGADGWRRLLVRIAQSEADVVAVDLDGVAPGERRHDLVAFDAERVGLLVGAPRPVEGAYPLYLEDSCVEPRSLLPAYLAIRPACLREVGELDAVVLSVGANAVAAELRARVVAAGHLVAHQDVGAPRMLDRSARSQLAGAVAGGIAARRNPTEYGRAWRGCVPAQLRPRACAMAVLHAVGALVAGRPGR